MSHRPYLTIVPPQDDRDPLTLDEVIRMISMDAILPSRIQIPTRPINGEDVDRAIRKYLDKLVEIYLEESRLRKPS